MNSDIASVLVAVLSSNVIVELIRWIVGRSKKSEELENKFNGINASLDDLKHEMKSMKRNEIRLQLMLLMSDYPNKTEEIMLVAERYFKELGGDWYLTGFFKNWLDEQDIPEPSWLK